MTRLLDILLSSLALMLMMPIFLLVVSVLRFTGEGEVFYLQKRVGQNENIFNVIKFATMLKNSANMKGGTITTKNDPRILPFGKFLRDTKINELPQLVNVIKGEMSLIGPRPLAVKNYHYYDAKTRKKISKIKPGLSGIGSIVFRSEEDMLFGVADRETFYRDYIAPYKAELELWYSDNNTFYNYLLLIFLTLYVVVSSDNKIIWRCISSLPQLPSGLNQFTK